jgi:transposase InsO family protein
MQQSDELHLDTRSRAAGCRAIAAWRERRERALPHSHDDEADRDRGSLPTNQSSKTALDNQIYCTHSTQPRRQLAEPGVAMNITYIPVRRDGVYLAVVVDWFRRRILAWRVSIDIAKGFCLEAVKEALAQYGKSDIFNTDQGL